MGLSRLDNFLKSARGTIIYVDPNSLDSTDSIENQGNSLTRPFRTVQRALIEAARFSYQRGLDNDRFNKTTIILYPGEHIIDNRPGWIPDGASNYRLRSGATSADFGEFSNTTDFDIVNNNNALYKLNSINGGVIIPRGTSLVGYDLRKTKIRPLYVPNPENDSIERSCIFRLTGGCYISTFTIFDADPNGTCYKDYTSNIFVPNFSHHKLAVFEYADGVNNVKIADDFQTFETARTDLDIYYEKIGIAYGNSSGRPISPDYPASGVDIQPVIDEYRIVGSRGASVGISSIKSGDGATGNTTITVTTSSSFPQLAVDTPIQISGVSATGYNGQFVVFSVASDTQFTYKVQNIPTNLLPSVSGATANISVDTVTSASPYIFNCSLRSVFGMCGCLSDGAKADGFKSTVIAQYTGIGLQKDEKAFVKFDLTSGTYQDFTAVSNLQSNSLSRFKPSYENFHIKAVNNAYHQLVSIFAIGYAQHFSVDSGGDHSINNSNSNFGAKAFQASGYRRDAFAKDDIGYITNIITPKEREINPESVSFYPIDYTQTVAAAQTGRLYLHGYTDQDNAPSEVTEGYRIGAKEDDYLFLGISQSGVTTTYSARVVMPNTQVSAEKSAVVGRLAGINSITSNVITLTGVHNFINGESVRIISSTAQLPDGVESDTLYYAITNTTSVGISSQQIKIAKSLNDAINDTPVTINSRGGILKIVSRVSDKKSGDIGHPIGFDTTRNQWYVNVATAASENSIYPALNSAVLYNSTERTFFKRTPDVRQPDDTIYRLRYVVPKDTVTPGAAPVEGYIIQDSNNVLGAGTTEIQKYFSPTSVTLSNADELRNFRFVSGAEWAGNVAKITTELPHTLRVGSQVEVLNVVSTANTTGIASTAFNGTFTVTGISSAKQFSYTLTQNPGTFTGVTTNRTSSLPYFKKKQLATDFQIYKSVEVQEYVQNVQDGIYYLTLVNYGNSPSVAPFTHLKLSQPIEQLYPQTNRDNPISDPQAARTFAVSDEIGTVIVDDKQNSITKQTTEKILTDLRESVSISDIRSLTGTAHTIFTTIDHGLSGITSVRITNAGAGYTNGTFYAVRLGVSTTGVNANARVTVSAAGTITNVQIMDGGSAYRVGDVITLSGIGTYAPHTPATLTVANTYDHIGECISISGVSSDAYSGYNTLYKITGITTNNQITVESSKAISGFSSQVGSFAESANLFLTGKTLGISTISYYAPTGIATITFPGSHPFIKNSKVRIGGADKALFNGDFIVTKINSATSIAVNLGIASATTPPGGLITIYQPGLTSYGGDIEKEFEGSSGRLSVSYAGITTTLGSSILSTDSESTPLVVNNADILGFKIGDYFSIDDEIFRINQTVSGSTVYAYRALFGTPLQDHSSGTAVRHIHVYPIELRRNSIIRASAHTFEYLGFGPGNYSTAFPDRQNRTLTSKEIELSHSFKVSGGAVQYSGMDDRGDFYTTNRVTKSTGEEESFNAPVITVTGDKVLTPEKQIQTFESPIVVDAKLTSTSEDGIETRSLLLQGDADVARKFTVGIGTTPAIAGNSGDVVYKARPVHNEYLGWVYTVDNQWEPFGFIGTLPNGLVFGGANQVLYKSPSNTNSGNANFLFQDNSTLIIGAATSTGFANQKLQITGNAYVSSGIGIGTTGSRSALDVVGNARISGIVTVGTDTITLNGSSNVINVGITSISSGIITASTGIVTYYGDGSRLTNLPTGSQWSNVGAGLGTGIYRNGNVGIGTTLTPARLNVSTGVSTSVDGGLARFLAPNLAVSSSAGIAIGRTFGTDNFQSVLLAYNYQGSSASSGSYLSIAHAGQGNTLVVADNNRVGMGTATPRATADIIGSVLASVSAGVGTANPTSNLHVIGTSNITGNTTIGGALNVTGNSTVGGNLTVTGSLTATGSIADTLYAFGNTGTAPTIDLSNGTFVTATLTGNATFAPFTNTPATTTSFTLFLTNDSTPGRTITWPANVNWPNGVVPSRTTTANRSDVYTFFTKDGGSNWYGILSIYNYV